MAPRIQTRQRQKGTHTLAPPMHCAFPLLDLQAFSLPTPRLTLLLLLSLPLFLSLSLSPASAIRDTSSSLPAHVTVMPLESQDSQQAQLSQPKPVSRPQAQAQSQSQSQSQSQGQHQEQDASHLESLTPLSALNWNLTDVALSHRRQLAVGPSGVDGNIMAAFFIAYLKNQSPAYSNFARVLERTGFNNTLAVILNTIAVTIMVPRNDVMPLSMATSKYITQRLGFHILVGRRSFAELTNARAGTKYASCDFYPKTNAAYMYKLKPKVTQFGGKPADKAGGRIVLPEFFNHPSRVLLAHGVSKFMVPYRYY